MSNITKFSLDIGSQKKTVIMINHRDEPVSVPEASTTTKSGPTKEQQDVLGPQGDSTHYLIWLDRSGSMWGNIREAIDDIKKIVTLMGDEDYLTVGWFSGHGEHRVLIKAARKDEKTLHRLLDSIAYALGITVFSEPLEEIGHILDETAPICDRRVVMFFTDGQPVVDRWSYNEEVAKMTKAVMAISPKVLAFNTVGYGSYYNRDTLVMLSAMTQFGQFTHASKIGDISKIWEADRERVADTVKESVIITAPDYADIVYLTSKSTRMIGGHTGLTTEIALTSLDKRKNQFFILFDEHEDDKNLIDYVVNGKSEWVSVNLIKESKPHEATIKNLLYALADRYYYTGERGMTLATLATLKDKALIDSHVSAFTPDEIAEQQKRIKKALFGGSKYRMTQGEAPKGYVPPKDAFCVMDLLKLLASNGKAWYLASSNYSRIGLKTEDQFNLFKRDKEKAAGALMGDFVYNSKYLNMSLRFNAKGNVKLLPGAATASGLDMKFDKGLVPTQIIRNHTIIKDGTLNMSTIRVLVNSEAFNAIEEAELKFMEGPAGQQSFINEYTHELQPEPYLHLDGMIDENGNISEKVFEVELNLALLPVINQTYAEALDDPSVLLNTAYEECLLEARQKVLKHYMDTLKSTNKKFLKEDGVLKQFTPDQIAVLEQHGLDKSLNYKGVDNITDSKDGADFYEARKVELQVAGWSSLPSVEEVLQKIKDINDPEVKKKPKLNGPGQVMADVIGELKGFLGDKPGVKEYRLLQKDLTRTKGKLFQIRTTMAAARIAKVLTGGWWTGLDGPDVKGGYTFEKNGQKLTIKTGRDKQYYTPPANAAAIKAEADALAEPVSAV